MKNKMIGGYDFMGNRIYWMNGLSLDMAQLSEDVCCIYKNPYYNPVYGSGYNNNKYVVQITRAPYHEDVSEWECLDLKSAKVLALKKWQDSRCGE